VQRCSAAEEFLTRHEQASIVCTASHKEFEKFAVCMMQGFASIDRSATAQVT
jgi:hypothetical protein